MEWLLIAGLVVGGVINLLPLPAAISAAGLTRLYNLRISDPDLVIMLRHRSAVFAVIGVLLLAAIARPDLRGAAILAGLASAATFNLIAWQVGGYSAAIRRVFIADIVAILALALAGAAHLAR